MVLGVIARMTHLAIIVCNASSGSTKLRPPTIYGAQQSVQRTHALLQRTVSDQRKCHNRALMSRMVFIDPSQILKKYHNVHKCTELTITVHSTREMDRGLIFKLLADFHY